MSINSIHWFRKGLRLHDNPALLEAARGSHTLRCVYFLDPWFAGASNRGVNRWRFLLQCLEDLDSSLRKLNSCLFVIRGQPANIFPRLFKEWKVSRLTFESDSEPFGKERDAAIKKLASEAGVEVITKISHTLYDLNRITELNGGQPPLTYKRFQTLVSSMEPPEPPREPLTRELLGDCVTPVSGNHRERYGVPLLEELGFDTESLAPAVWPGGESEALMRLERQLGPDSTAWQENFERPKMSSSPLLASPLGLSPYLRFGCLSCRLFYYKLTELYNKVKKNTSPSISLYDKLLWREFFYTAASNNPRFDRMEGNPICIRIPWDRNPEALAKWAEAKTGFPWIDAIMTQLRQEGWIHHLARHAVACFLTRGDLWISWEEGMKVFEELLLDADWSVNAGSWLCHSCSSFFQQFFHCYCPVGFGRRIDPNGDFIRWASTPLHFLHLDPVVGVSEAQGAAAPPTRRRPRSGTSTHRVRREQLGLSGAKHRGAKHLHALSHRTSPYTTPSDLSEHDHEFAIPQQPGRLIWPVGGGTGKREREAEHSSCHGDDGPSPSSSALKAQDDEKWREDGEGVAFSS
uniref:Cryptochrome circadian regulator 3b n=1 Tax=Cyprinus carpio TaxID=7962 RepID=A0A8C1TA63_CYPCA